MASARPFCLPSSSRQCWRNSSLSSRACARRSTARSVRRRDVLPLYILRLDRQSGKADRAAGLTLEPHATTVALHYFARREQPKPQPAVLTADIAAALEALKHLALLAGRHAHALVGD